jgi:sugar phosphate isomerase/epimerase
VQIDALGDLSPRALSETGIREFKNLLRSHDLELTALGCPLRRGLDTPEDQQPRIEHVKRVLTLSFELGARIVIVEAGHLPINDDDQRLPYLTESLTALGRHADRVGATLALQTGLEAGEKVRSFLDRFETGGLGVNLDGANILLHGNDPYIAIRALAHRIVHAQARDARPASSSRAAQEVPLGHGDIDWLQLLAVLEEVEYRRWLVIARDTGDQRPADIAAGVGFLRRLMR